MISNLNQQLHTFWFLERFSFKEKQERLLKHLKMLDKCLETNIIYPHITNLEKVIIHQRLLYSTTIPTYTVLLHPRYSGKRNAKIQIPTDSEYFQEILKLIEWSQGPLMDYHFAFMDLHENCLDQILLIQENQSSTLYWGSVYQNTEKLINFEKIKVNDKNGIIFTIPKNNSKQEEELRYSLISPNFRKDQLDILVRQKLILQLKEDLFL